MSPQNKPQSSYIPTLDGWRAIAILGVMTCHSTDRLLGQGGPLEHSRLHALTREGALGVDLFFAISGFLITQRLLQHYDSRQSWGLRGFYIRRVFRILPPYFFFLIILGLLYAGSFLSFAPYELLSSFFFLRNYLPIQNPTLTDGYTGHLWSIAVEEHFYLLWPSLLLVFGLHGGLDDRLKKNRAIWGAFLICLGIATWRFFDFKYHFFETVLPNIGFFSRSDVRMDSLLWGCLAALILRVTFYRDFFTRFLKDYLYWLIVLIWCCFVFFHLPFKTLVLPILTPLLILGTVLYPKRYFSRALEAKPLTFIGRISYSLYLWNSLFMLAQDQTSLSGPLSIFQGFPWQWGLTFLMACLSYYGIEKPLIRIGYRFAPAPQTGR